MKLRIKTKRSQFSVEGGEEGNRKTVEEEEEEEEEEAEVEKREDKLLSGATDQRQKATCGGEDTDASKELMAGGRSKL